MVDTTDGEDGLLDIIGMWPKTRIINGFEVPAPETQDPEEGTTTIFRYCTQPSLR